MNRAKRIRRGSTADRASVDTTTSSASTSSSQQPSQKKPKIEDGRETSATPGGSLDMQPPSPISSDLIEELFTAVVGQTDEKMRPMIGAEFSLLPSRKVYPDYYQVTAKPIDLKQIAIKIQKGEYAGLDGLVDDLTLMANNAINYNIPSSQIHKEAVTLKKFVAAKKAEYEQRELHRTAERTVRTRRSTAQATQPVSAVFAALEYGDDVEDLTDDEDGTPEETMEADSEDEASQDTGSIITRQDGGDDRTAAMLELYNSVVKLKGTTNRPITGPFMKLPSKRIYPQYYTAVLSPVALSNMRAKIKNGMYQAIDELLQDLLLMCQNARTFNNNNSVIYRNSERIKRFVEGKEKEYRAELLKNSNPLRTALSERLWPEYDDSLLRKRCKFLVRSMLECRVQGEYLAENFLEKPSKKDYPDYYNVITQPMDLKTLSTKVVADKYASEEALLVDIALMCNNAKMYNEEGSDIYEAAVKFEETVKRAQKILDAAVSVPSTSHGSSPRRSTAPSRRSSTKFPPPTSPLQAALIELYEHVTEFTDVETGRKLSSEFQTLPQKSDMPSYYDVIKKPIDLDKIQYRILHNQYPSFQDAIEDFGQMFENAAAFNEPTSGIYRDALILLNAVMEKSATMISAFTEIPNVQKKVQEILRTLMDSVLNFTKPDGRNVSDTIAECSWNDSDTESETSAADSDSSVRTTLTLELIKANVYAGRYRRLDRFQDDMFALLEKARFTAQPDSQTYEDAVELHLHFITTRDELCGNGTKLLTSALHFTVGQFNASIEQERKEAKLRPPSVGAVEESASRVAGGATVVPLAGGATVVTAPSAQPIMDPSVKCVMVGMDAYYPGDFVYVEPYDKGKQPLIVLIQELIEQNGDQSISGCYMLRPEETFHPATRRFYEKEVFKSDMKEVHVPGRILGRCFVMGGKDYFKLRPVGLDAKDVYVCDTRYSTKAKSFQKIKVWKMPENSRIQLIPRETPLPAIRIPSVFATLSREGSSKQEADLFPLCKESEVIDVMREPVLAKSSVPEAGTLAYEQKESPVGFIKIGDCFMVKKEAGDRIIKLERIFDKGQETFVSGSVFVFPKDLPASLILPAKLFYHNEVFQKVADEVYSVNELTTRCAVLSLRDFATCRQTEIPEEHVYVVETKLFENGSAVKRVKGSRLLNVSTAGLSHATNDEIFFFDTPVDPRRVVSPLLEPVLSGKVVEIDRTPEESPVGTVTYDDDSQSVSHASEISFATPLSPAASNYEGTAKKKRSHSAKKAQKKVKYTVSGFILYGADNRRQIKMDHPGLSFQETSRHVSDMWKALAPAERKRWEDEAKRKSNFVNSEMKSRGYGHLDGISFKGLGSKNDIDLIVELERRAQQQEANIRDEAQQAKISAAASQAASQQSTQNTSGTSSQQQQQQQQQHQQAQSSASSNTGQPGLVKTEAPKMETVNIMSPQALAMLQAQQQQFQRLLQQQQQQMQQQQLIQRPLFLTLPAEPPKVKRALHTEVFLRYLENNGMGEHPKPAVPYWRRQLSASQDNTHPPRQVPDYWPSLLNIDAETKNKGMEVVHRMWSTRNLIFTKTCGLNPVAAAASSSGGGGGNGVGPSGSQVGPSRPFSPPPPAMLPQSPRDRSSRRSTASRR